MREPDWKHNFAQIKPLGAIRYQDPWTPESLQRARHVCDPLADTAIAELRKDTRLGNPEDMLAIVRQRAESHGGPYREFVDTCHQIPEWVDFDAMRAGQRLIASTGPFMGLSLLTGSLVGGYIFHKASMVTAMTGRLAVKGDISRRLLETSALIFHLSRPDEARPGGKGHDIAMRVRLLHGAIRTWVRGNPRWREEWDAPINQEDLAITLSEFSYMNMRNLLRMGVKLTDTQIDSHFQLWRWVGHVLGIQEQWLPASFDEEVQQFECMLKHQAQPKLGHPAVRNILDEIADKGPAFMGRDRRRKFLYQATAHAVGDELVEGLRLKRQPDYWGHRAVRAAAGAWNVVHNRVPGGEAWLHRRGQETFDRRLADAARVKKLGYAVKTHDPETIRKAIRGGKAA